MIDYFIKDPFPYLKTLKFTFLKKVNVPLGSFLINFHHPHFYFQT